MTALALDTDLTVVATKKDLLHLEQRLQKEMAENKSDILKWVMGAMGFQTAAIIGAVAALIRLSAG